VTTALVAALASLATLAVVGALLAVRRRRSGRDRLGLALAAMNSRLEAMSQELAAAAERAEEERRRNRTLAELGGTIELDEVLSRTLEAACRVRGADAALIAIEGPEGRPIVATLGLSNEEAHRQATVGPPDGRRVRSTAIAYSYPPEALDEDDSLVHAGLAVPLPGEPDPVGSLTVYSRSPDGAFADDAVRDLEELAAHAGPALVNARRFREARRLADLDALTGLHNRRFFHDTLAREVARAQRYDRRLALIVLDLDDFKRVNDRVGHLAGDSALAEVAERLLGVVRGADVACRVGGDEFAVILPESTVADADRLYRRIETAVASRPVAGAGTLTLSGGVAELRSGDDAVSFFQRGDDALYRAKEHGKGRAAGASGDRG
jgi:diguanylate cyclase (GGDEF)-like protein